METFAKLRKMKSESEEPHSEDSLIEKVIAQIEDAIAKGGYLSVLFHPFLTNSPERLRAFETVVSFLARKRNEGTIWLARCQDVQAWLMEHPNVVGSDAGLDETQWR